MEENFEVLLSKLEDVCSKLQSGDVTLDKAVELYKQGIELSNKCNEILKDAKQQITLLGKEVEESNND